MKIRFLLTIFIILLFLGVSYALNFNKISYKANPLTDALTGATGNTNTSCTGIDAALGLCNPCNEIEILFGTCHYINACNKKNPGSCNDKASCERYEHIWCNNKCYDSKEAPAECRITCGNNEFLFVSDFKDEPIETCVDNSSEYMPHFDNSTEFNILKNVKNSQEKMIRIYSFPLYTGDNLIDGIINNGDILNLKVRYYPLNKAYDLYVAIMYHSAGNTNSMFFFTETNNGWKITTEIKPFRTNISFGKYSENKFGQTFDICHDLLEGLTGNLSVWYFAFPTSTIYPNDINGLYQRFYNQEFSIGYYTLINQCNK